MNARIVWARAFTLGEVDPRLFGGLAELVGRHIYGGIYEPGHPDADKQGFRRDVIALVKELGMPVMRYPGGNFVSGYRWEDGVGPRERRPARLDPAWFAAEPNHFGTNEFVDWCRKVRTAPMLAVNLGTRGPEEARHLVEYCNHPGGSVWSDLRREHGYAAPHDVRLWCLGNEMDGSWQVGQKTAAEYGRAACEAAKQMKAIDPRIEVVACGSSCRGYTTYIEWEQTVLRHAFHRVDYLSIHGYLANKEGDTPKFLARTDDMDAFIEEVVAACDAVAARLQSRKRIMLSFDEWNVWYHTLGAPLDKPDPWNVGRRLLEDIYTYEDALCVGGMLISLLNHADRVKIACLAQVVNAIAPIMTEPGGPAWRQTIFHPFALASRYGRGTALRAHIESPGYPGDGREASFLKAAAVWKPAAGELVLFLLNRNLEKALDLTVEPRAFGEFAVAEWTLLQNADLKAVNTMQAPDTVCPVAAQGASVRQGRAQAQLPPASWSMIRLVQSRNQEGKETCGNPAAPCAADSTFRNQP